jgi:UDP-2,3-diacylglucosamine hydrolase
MRIAAISDVHVKVPNDDADRLLTAFFMHPEVLAADYVFLLGDIYDLMCGPHREYVERFRHHFQAMEELLRRGKKVYFFEGNHDVHLEKLFREVWGNRGVVVTQRPAVLEISGKKYYVSHGDEHEVENQSYHRYIRFIRSRPLRFVAEHLMPFRVLNYFGNRASNMSRKKGAKRFDAEGVRHTFREGVRKTTKGEFDFVLGGHSHVKDLYQIPGTTSTYLNNGYALHTKTFICIRDHNVDFLPLT